MMRDDKIDKNILDESLQILRDHFSQDCDITSAKLLSDPARRNVIVRINLESASSAVPASVILKQSLPVKSENTEAEEFENKLAFERFSRDWAGLQFSSSIKENIDNHNVPFFYGASHANRFILIEDLGENHVSLVDSLTALDREQAVSALERYMKALGSFHAASVNHLHEYEITLKNINKNPVAWEMEMENASIELLKNISDVVSREKLAINMSKDFKDEVHDVMNGIFNPKGPFAVLTHGDIAPDNVFDHKGGKELQLIDFEWCAIRNALLDGTYLRMSIPTGWCAKTVPDEIRESVETIYRNELKKKIPAAEKDDLYQHAYTQACAFHVLQQMALVNLCLKNDRPWDLLGDPPPNWDQQTNTFRPRVLTRLQAFIDVATANENNSYPAITQMAADILANVKVLWPDAKPLDAYPAFNTVELQSQVSSYAGIAKSLEISGDEIRKSHESRHGDEDQKNTQKQASVESTNKSHNTEKNEKENTSIKPFRK